MSTNTESILAVAPPGTIIRIVKWHEEDGKMVIDEATVHGTTVHVE